MATTILPICLTSIAIFLVALLIGDVVKTQNVTLSGKTCPNKRCFDRKNVLDQITETCTIELEQCTVDDESCCSADDKNPTGCCSISDFAPWLIGIGVTVGVIGLCSLVGCGIYYYRQHIQRKKAQASGAGSSYPRSAPAPAYPRQAPGYPPQAPGYPSGYPAQAPGYPPPPPGYPPSGPGYPPSGPGYPPQAPGYPPPPPGYPPPPPGYPPQAPGYPPQAPGYPPQAPGYPASAPGYPGYPPPYPGYPQQPKEEVSVS